MKNWRHKTRRRNFVQKSLSKCCKSIEKLPILIFKENNQENFSSFSAGFSASDKQHTLKIVHKQEAVLEKNV